MAVHVAHLIRGVYILDSVTITIQIILGRSFRLFFSYLLAAWEQHLAREIHGFTHPIYNIGIPGRLCGQYVCRVNSTPTNTLSHLHHLFLAPFSA